MVHAARASTASAPAPLSSRQFLIGHAAIKNARNSPENNALNFSNRLKKAICSARFSQVLRSKDYRSRGTYHASRFTSHQSRLTNHAFLIASRQILKIELTPSQQTRKHFLIATFSRISAPLLTNHHSPIAPFLFNTNKAHKIIILVRALMKTKEKQFSIQYKFAVGSIGNLACAPFFAFEFRSDNTIQHQAAQAELPVPPNVLRPRFSLRGGFMYSAEPMLDLGYVREHLDVIEKMARDRGATLDLAPFRALDTDRRMVITSAERLKAERNKASEEIARMKKCGEDCTALLTLMKQVSDKIKRDDETITVLDEQLKQFLLTVPNIPHSSVPVGKSAADNVEVRRWGAPPQFDFKPKAHWELGEGAEILDFDAAIKIAGSRFAVYKGLGARLERALANFFLDVHTREHGYTEILPPFLVNTASLTGVGQLPKFAADMFHLEGTDLWLTPTSEVELTSLYRDTTLEPDVLPIKVCAWTACFRSEAGAAGRDTRGLKRQHQFQKVEMFKFTRPEQSYDELEALVGNAEAILQRLGLHYRVMLLSTADMGFASAKTYDIEVWLPSAGEFMEISSCSNTEAFQARRSGIRFKPPGAKKSEFVHTLNGSGLAVGRTWIALLENFQRADGSVVIPEALRSYMGVDVIPGAAKT
jgi:seryl-tRNA synthetase